MISKEMDFPSSKKTRYADQVAQANTLEPSVVTYLPVPGPVGPKGDIGNIGSQGPIGLPGKDGKTGPKGKEGNPGKDAPGHLPSSGQGIGWARYSPKKIEEVITGATRGTDGWVDLSFKTSNTVEFNNFLPLGSAGLYSPGSRRLNFKGLKIGARVSVTYKLSVTTLSPNTEILLRSYFPQTKKQVLTLVGTTKYVHTYSFDVTQDFVIENESDRVSGAIPEMLTDMSASASLESVTIFVS